MLDWGRNKRLEVKKINYTIGNKIFYHLFFIHICNCNQDNRLDHDLPSNP